jgi:hypothetical protein
MALSKRRTSQGVFEQEHLQCRDYAAEMIYSARPGQASLHTAIGGAAFGTLLGAPGTAISGAARAAGAGVAIGSAAGLVGGSGVAAKNAKAGKLQKRHNMA